MVISMPTKYLRKLKSLFLRPTTRNAWSALLRKTASSQSGSISAPSEIAQSFGCYEDWQSWSAANPYVFDANYVESIVAYAREHGVQSAFLGPIPASEVIVCDSNYRESLWARRLNPRLRAVLDLMAQEPVLADVHNVAIYAPEALTEFALVLRGRYPRFIGSEYAETAEQRQKLFPIMYQDLLNVDFPSNSFDLIISNEVLEHVPDLPRALSETARILKPSGVMIATVPFCYGNRATTRKAWFVDGKLQYAGEPEYHGNPVDPKGSLVFQIPGWDILDMCRHAGFREASMQFISSHIRGITGAEIAGVLVLRAAR
jgi:hypothetical protein